MFYNRNLIVLTVAFGLLCVSSLFAQSVGLKIDGSGNVSIPTGRLQLETNYKTDSGVNRVVFNRHQPVTGPSFVGWSPNNPAFKNQFTILSASNYPFNLVTGKAQPVNFVLNSYGSTSPDVEFSDTGRYTFRGNLTANHYNYFSDGRWKKNIRTIPNALNRVQRLRGVDFEWRREEFKNQHFDSGKRIGFVAQEVEAVIPEIVSADEAGHKAVDYGGFAPVLVEAVKELKAEKDDEIAALKKENASLKAQLNSLGERLARLEKK